MTSSNRWADRTATFCKLLAVLSAALFFSAPANAADNGAPGEITILTGSDPYYLPIIVAVENGYFKDEGLTVKHRMFPSGTDAMLAFRGIGAEFVASGDSPSLVLWDGGDVVALRRSMLRQKTWWASFAPASSPRPSSRARRSA
jgi:ABC-type nitrate/sulfonate/bicarbonate transport system substrate-binding protein